MMTALVMTGRIGATITAELGTMRVTEQIDALESLSFDPIGFLIFPRIFAAIVIFPVLIIIGDFFGIFITNHPDLRRILTDYSFEGFPLRKDFPLIGTYENLFLDTYGGIYIVPIMFSQKIRFN